MTQTPPVLHNKGSCNQKGGRLALATALQADCNVGRASLPHVRATMAESWMPSQICLQFEGAALQKRSSLSCRNCVAGWEFE
jgi:hypothetical protein